MKKITFLVPVVAAALMLNACHDKDDDNSNDNTVVADEGKSAETFNPEILFKSSAYVSGSVNADMKTALGYGITDINAAADANNTNLLVVSKLTEESEDVLKAAYQAGKTIAVVNPVKSELDAFNASHDWIDLFTENVTDGMLLYSFTIDNHFGHIDMPETVNAESSDIENTGEETTKAVVGEEPISNTYYVFLSTWLTNLNKKYVEKVEDSGANSGDGTTSMESFANSYHIDHTYNFNSNYKFRKIIFSDADYMNGSGSLTAVYDVYMVHVYEGETGAGDYYGVKMNASVASANMWKNKGWNTHGGVYVRWCGMYCKGFTVSAHLGTSTDWNSKADVSFTAGGFPSPATVVSSTTYEDAQSFSLTMSQSIGADAGMEAGPEGGAKASAKVGGKLSFSEGWSWSHSETRTVYDTDIENRSADGAASWHLSFNNLPYFDWSEDYGFKITDSKTYRSTAGVEGSWLWYDKNGKDDQDKAPYYLCSYVKADYEMQSFITTKADLKTDNTSFEQKKVIALPKMINAKAGFLTLKNDLKDEMSIYNVEVRNALTGEVVYKFNNTIPNGGDQDLGAFKSAYKYTVSFLAKKPGGESVKYTYSLNPNIEVVHKSKTTLYALSDFRAN